MFIVMTQLPGFRSKVISDRNRLLTRMWTCSVSAARTTHLSRTRIELPMFLLFCELRTKKTNVKLLNTYD